MSDTQKTPREDRPGTKPRIYAWINGRFGPADLVVVALAEDGASLAQHVSSSPSWAKHDIGVTGDWKHDTYREYYPDGYEVEWVDEPHAHDGLAAALERNHAMYEHDSEQQGDTAHHPADDAPISRKAE